MKKISKILLTTMLCLSICLVFACCTLEETTTNAQAGTTGATNVVAIEYSPELSETLLLSAFANSLLQETIKYAEKDIIYFDNKLSAIQTSVECMGVVRNGRYSELYVELGEGLTQNPGVTKCYYTMINGTAYSFTENNNQKSYSQISNMENYGMYNAIASFRNVVVAANGEFSGMCYGEGFSRIILKIDENGSNCQIIIKDNLIQSIIMEKYDMEKVRRVLTVEYGQDVSSYFENMPATVAEWQ